MKINIFYKINKGPYGGGNQFLKALRDYFISINVYEENSANADIILFNSHHNFSELIKFKQKHPEKIFVHRIDGPVTFIRKNDTQTDRLIYKINNIIADASIFQSDWSKQKNYELGIKKKKFESIIINAPNPLIFNNQKKTSFNKNSKVRLIATSWSHNLIKGFEVYKWLDESLDFSKYEMTFCGNSPFKFRNIRHIKPLPSTKLAKELKKHDIFITASQKDPCSNSLIEALHCGLPAIVLNDGGHPEIIKKGGVVFNNKEEIPQLIEIIIADYDFYSSIINLPNMTETGKKYFDFIKSVVEQKEGFKKLNISDMFSIYLQILNYKVLSKINR
ncbi:MAG: glycosyltransferase [Bacteroidales bacterium]|nr:glycosyltransferase [Bacteroidales bacterium]